MCLMILFLQIAKMEIIKEPIDPQTAQMDVIEEPIDLKKSQVNVIEEPITRIKFKSKDDLTNLGLENAIIQDGNIKMRASTDLGSLISFKERNKADEWSIEFKFDDPNLKYPEFAGIYLWYTDQRIKSGKMAGIDGNFTGLMAGIEFLGKGLQLIIGGNLEERTVENAEEIIYHKDRIAPVRFKDVSEFRIKIISTKKNLKIEIYEKDKLLYDYLRFLDTSILGDRGKGKYFGITTIYQKTSSYKAFVLKDIQAFSRIEHSDYDPLKFEAEDVKEEPRLGHDIDYSSKEVQHLISNVEHMMAYLKIILGKPGGSTVYQSAYDAKIATFESQKMLKNLKTDINTLEAHLKHSGTQILGTKIGDVEMEIRNLKRVVYETQNTLQDLRDGLKSNNSHLILILCIVSVFAFVLYMLMKRDKLTEKKIV